MGDEVELTDGRRWLGPTWSLAGLAPMVDDVQITVVQPSDLDIHYPQETFTSLLRDARLEDGETDEASFRLGEAHWGQTIDIELRVTYLIEGRSGHPDPSVDDHQLIGTS